MTQLMDRVLRFKPHLRVARGGEGRVFLVGEHDHFLLQGRLHELVAPLVDGQRSGLEIIRALEGKASPAEIYYALSVLEERGYAVPVESVGSLPGEAFWYSLGLGPQDLRRLSAVTVGLDFIGKTGSMEDKATEALTAAGLRVEAGAAFRIVITEDYLHPDLVQFNRESRKGNRSWMLLKPFGTTPWLGPIFRPGVTGCWLCLAHRLRANRPVEAYLQRISPSTELSSPLLPCLPVVSSMTIELGVVLFARWMAAGEKGACERTLFSLAVAPPSIQEHAVVRRPQCPACGDPELFKKRAWAPVALEPRVKSFTADGGHRCATPEETWERLRCQLSPITGVVASLGPVPQRDHPLRPVYAGTYFVIPPNDRPSFGDFVRPSLGKGRTPAQARASAICEAIERWSALFQGDEAMVRARADQLGDAAIDPTALQNFSDAQYRQRTTLNAGVTDPRRLVPEPFDRSLTIDWVPAWSLTHEQCRYLPAAYCYLNLPSGHQDQCCSLDPNGHAAGNCLEEAILQACFELAERDAVGIWWYNRLRRPAVDLASFDEPYFDALSSHYASMGYRLWVLDVTTDLGIPAMVALAHSSGTNRLYCGFGCHFDPRLGVQRALTEVNQMFDPSHEAPLPCGDVTSDGYAFLLPSDTAPLVHRNDFEVVDRDNLRDDIQSFVERAGAAGLETIVLDQTRPDTGLSVVKAVVPGLRHIWPRLGPGRLYDVPLRLGWLQAPHLESELNPVPLYV